MNEELKTGPRPPTIVVDIDGVIATGTREEVYSDEAGWAYEKCKPIMRTIEALRALKDEGIRIVLHTSRWQKDEEITLIWLGVHDVPFDELIMGKPSGDLYIDDRNFPAPFIPRYESVGLMRGVPNPLFQQILTQVMDHYNARKK